MNEKCFDIGTIQAFLDGETAADVTLRLSEHIEECAACAQMLTIAEDENSFVFSTLEREMNTLVPTQRLWSRINESIEVEKSHQPIWKQVYAFFAASLLSPSMTAAAGVLIVFGFAAVIWTLRSGAPVDGPVAGGPSIPSTESLVPVAPASDNSAAPASSNPPIHVTAGNRSGEEIEKLLRDEKKRNEIRPTTAEYYGPTPGERTYIKTISDLKQAYDGRRDVVLTGSSRVAFERDIAVVNDAIKRGQKAVRKNPKNQAARQVLYSAYQDKIDLLNTIAQRDELMASIR